jgi:hypothetical protein
MVIGKFVDGPQDRVTVGIRYEGFQFVGPSVELGNELRLDGNVVVEVDGVEPLLNGAWVIGVTLEVNVGRRVRHATGTGGQRTAHTRR